MDFIAPDLGSLLKMLDGREVKTSAGERTIHTAGKNLHFHTPGLREKLLSILANPNLAYILLMIGMMGLYFELAHPGGVFPGVIGGLALILAFFAMSTLPVSYAGLALLGLAVIFFVAELLVASKGLLALGGAVSLVLGSIMLFDSDEEMLRVSLSILLPTALGVVGFFGTVTYLAVRAQVARATTGSEGMVGLKGVVIEPGKVMVRGELWRARPRGGRPSRQKDRGGGGGWPAAQGKGAGLAAPAGDRRGQHRGIYNALQVSDQNASRNNSQAP